MKKFIKKHLFLIIAVFVVANSSALYLYFSKASACMDQAAINADSRCLYVYNGNVYQKGSRNNPHQGVDCGSNVDNIIPNFHFSGGTFTNFNSAKVTAFCAANATAAPTASPLPTSIGTIPNWDVDQNGVINVVDIGLVVDQYGKTTFANPRVDVDRNGTVNIIDIGIVVDHYQ